MKTETDKSVRPLTQDETVVLQLGLPPDRELTARFPSQAKLEQWLEKELFFPYLDGFAIRVEAILRALPNPIELRDSTKWNKTKTTFELKFNGREHDLSGISRNDFTAQSRKLGLDIPTGVTVREKWWRTQGYGREKPLFQYPLPQELQEGLLKTRTQLESFLSAKGGISTAPCLPNFEGEQNLIQLTLPGLEEVVLPTVAHLQSTLLEDLSPRMRKGFVDILKGYLAALPDPKVCQKNLEKLGSNFNGKDWSSPEADLIFQHNQESDLRLVSPKQLNNAWFSNTTRDNWMGRWLRKEMQRKTPELMPNLEQTRAFLQQLIEVLSDDTTRDRHLKTIKELRERCGELWGKLQQKAQQAEEKKQDDPVPKLQHNAAELEQAKEQLEAALAQKRKVEQQLARLQAERELQKRANKTISSNGSNITGALEEYIEELEQKDERREEATHQLQQQLAELRGHLRPLLRKLEQERGRADEAETQLKGAQAVPAQLKARNTFLEGEIATLKPAAQRDRHTLNQLIHAFLSNDPQLIPLKRKHAGLVEELQELEQTCGEEQLKQCQEEIARIKAHIETLQLSPENDRNSASEIDFLQQEIGRLRGPIMDKLREKQALEKALRKLGEQILDRLS